MTAPAQLWIVSGPSSAGKSHLLGSSRIGEVVPLDPEAPVLFPRDLRRRTELAADSILHYNILRPAWRAERRGEAPSLDFSSDPKWLAALRLTPRRRAVILVARKETLIARATGRELHEPDRDLAYESEQWVGLYDRIDLDALYAAWREELARREIPWIELDSEAEGFPELSASA